MTTEGAVRARPERVDLILNQLDQLPTLPVIATRVLQATSDERSSAAEVIRLIESDQSLSAKVLRMVHAAAHGAPRDVDTVGKAVVLLGFNAVRHAVLSIKVFDTFVSGGSAESQFDRREFWKHSLAVGCAAQLLASRWRPKLDDEVAFVCGLLHDLGKVALDACLPKSYDRVISVARRRRVCILDVEQELLGVDHNVAGKRMAQRWKLPSSLVECIWLHHHTPEMLPESVQHPELVQIVNLADTLAREQRLGFSGFACDSTNSLAIARQMGLSSEILEYVTTHLLEAIEARAELLGLDELTPGTIYAEAVNHVNEELGRLNDALGESNSQLEARGSYLDLIHHFNEQLDTHLSMVDICLLGAEAGRSLLKTDAVAMFALQPDNGLCHIGLCDDHGSQAELAHEVGGLDGNDADPHLGIMPAPACAIAVRDALEGRLGGGPMWMIPIVRNHRLLGGVLFQGGRGDIEALNANPDEIHMFSTALAVAIRNGFQHTRLERLNEGLAQVNRQLKAAQAELLRRRSLTMIGDMAAGAAHELNNPLAVISGRGQLLASGDLDERSRKGLEIIAEQAHRASEIVNDLMEFAKPDPPQRESIELNGVLQACVAEEISAAGLSPDQVSLQLSDVETRAAGDSRQVRGMFTEIIRNAIQAMDPQTARLTIKGHHDVADDKVVVTIEDNGHGMAPEVLEKARDPFYSFRQAGRGRGLGLSRAARWCEINGGRMRLESESGVGTTVWVELDIPNQTSS